jgi:outer membrane protein assembly factor BamB
VIARLTGAVLGALLGVSAPALAALRVEPGWPVLAGAGSVHLGPGGGPVVITDHYGPDATTVSAFDKNGAVRWRSLGRWPCGNCDDGRLGPRLLPNGNYGPLGPEGDGIWEVTPQGSKVVGCNGDVTQDGACFSHETKYVGPTSDWDPVVTARRDGQLLWEYTQPRLGWSWSRGLEPPPDVFHDAAGGVYTTFGATRSTFGAPYVPSQLLALNRSTGTLRWRALGTVAVASLRSGVVGRDEGTVDGGYDSGAVQSITRFTANGAVQWVVPVRPDHAFYNFVADETRNRGYIQFVDTPRGRARLLAVELDTGSQLWSREVWFLSIGQGGVLLTSVDQTAGKALRAIGPDGRVRWEFGTATAVRGARQLPDRSIALTTASLGDDTGSRGLLWRIRPDAASEAPRAFAVALTPRRIRASCADETLACLEGRSLGSVLTVRTPKRADVRIRVLREGGAVARSAGRASQADRSPLR